MPDTESSGSGQSVDVFQLSGPLVFETVTNLVDSLPDEKGKLTIDLGKVSEADSSALSLFLEWQRQSESRGVALEFINWPNNLKSLHDLYNLSPVLSAK